MFLYNYAYLLTIHIRVYLCMTVERTIKREQHGGRGMTVNLFLQNEIVKIVSDVDLFLWKFCYKRITMINKSIDHILIHTWAEKSIIPFRGPST